MKVGARLTSPRELVNRAPTFIFTILRIEYMFPAMENQLEVAAKRMLTTLTSSSEPLKPLYLQPDRAIFLAEGSGIVLKVYSEGRTLQYEYAVAQKALASGVPIPEVLALEVAQLTVLAMKRVVGKPLSSS